MPFPCFHQRQGRDIALAALPSSIVRELAEVCREAWHGGMLAGCNGNASCRWQSPEGERIVITRSGAAKGRLTLRDLCVLDARSGATLYGGPSSSEGLMHLEVYAARPRCGAILHTHPRQLLALALKLECQPDWQERFLKLPVFESGVWRARLGYAPAFEPGTCERRLHQLGRSGRSHAHGNTRRLRLLQKCQEPLAWRHLGVAIDQNLAQLAIQLLAIRANAPCVVVGLAFVLERKMLKLGKIVDRHVDTVAVQ